MCPDTFRACDLSGFILSRMCDVFNVSADLLMDLYIETFKLVLNHTNCQFLKDEPYEAIWGHQEEIKKDTIAAEVNGVINVSIHKESKSLFSVFVPQ